MEELIEPKEYTYKLKATDFKQLFLASDDKAFNDIKKNIEEAKRVVILENGAISLENTEIEGSIPIRNENLENCRPLYCTNVKMGDLIIARSHLNLLNGQRGIYFTFDKCKIGSISVNAGASIGDIKLRQSIIKESIEIYEGKVDYIFIDASTINDIRITTQSSAKSLHIQESITGKIDLYNGQIDSIRIKYSSTSAISIFESQIKEKFKIEFSGIGYFTSHKSSINCFNIEGSHSGNFHISGTSMYSFEAVAVDCSYSIHSSRITILNLSACKIPTLSIGLSCEIEAYITGGWINKIDFSNITLRNETIISFVKVKIYSINMDVFNVLGNLYFREIKIVGRPFSWTSVFGINFLDNVMLRKEIYADLDKKYQAREKEYVKDCERLKEEFKKSTLKIVNSSLGKTEFTGCPLHQYTFIFFNSKISECFIFGGSFPSENVLIEGYTFKDPECYQHKILFLNQFIKICEAQGDLYHVSQFQAKWSEEQRKELKLRKKQEYADAKKPIWWSKIKIFFNTTSNDLCILWLNRVSNLYGESWLKPIVVFFLFVIPIVYLFYLCSIERLFVDTGFDKNLIWKYLEFINPAHSMKFIDENKKVEGIAILFDFIGRIFSAYAIYQFIAAFRKHTKKH